MTTHECSAIITYLYKTLKPVQKQMFDLILSNKASRKYIMHCSRRLGKTYLLVILSCCIAYSKDNAQIRYASVTQKSVRKMVHPIFKTVFLYIQDKYAPQWNSQEGAYIFPNGSMIHIAGVNNGRADDLRGTAADLCVVDESGFVDELAYLVDSVLIPQLITTGGQLLMASSSPVSPAHEFVDYITDARINKIYSSFTIHDAGFETEVVNEFMKEAKGPTSTSWRREYLNEIIVDSNFALIPEMNDKIITNVKKSDNFKHYHKYVSMDIGTKDLTFMLYAYYDFLRAKLCIIGENYINGPDMTTNKLAELIKAKEIELFQDQEIYKRIADNNNLLLLQDLGFIHDCHFIPTGKDSLEAMVNEMRLWVLNGRIEVDESCIMLIESMKYGFWNNLRTDFGRSKTLGHFDAIASLMYLIRNIDVVTNPIPVKISFDQIYIEDNNSNHHELTKLYKI